MERDILERLMDFDRCGLTASDRVNIRECAAIEIAKLRTLAAHFHDFQVNEDGKSASCRKCGLALSSQARGTPHE